MQKISMKILLGKMLLALIKLVTIVETGVSQAEMIIAPTSIRLRRAK